MHDILDPAVFNSSPLLLRVYLLQRPMNLRYPAIWYCVKIVCRLSNGCPVYTVCRWVLLRQHRTIPLARTCIYARSTLWQQIYLSGFVPVKLVAMQSLLARLRTNLRSQTTLPSFSGNALSSPSSAIAAMALALTHLSILRVKSLQASSMTLVAAMCVFHCVCLARANTWIPSIPEAGI
ncbi:hypothetical protein BC629DRAFT_444550 [Irpex lacteus]|nr:hypothetical protein BC629DRAFT_444550 [Irpex lacteus]